MADTFLNERQIRLYQQALRDLNGQANYDLLQIFRMLKNEASDPVFVRETLEDLLPQLIDQYGDVAARLSNEWFVALDHADGYRPVMPPPATHEAVSRSAAWAAQPIFDGQTDKVLDRLNGVAQRYIYNQARESIIENARAQGIKFARITRADGCAFCRMLASRGFVYDEDTGGVGENAYHDHCRCVLLPKRRGISEMNVPNLSKFRAEYYSARESVRSGSTRLILAEMRRG